ncbi:type IV secretion system protein [Caballeronia sordidicola]|uniref:Inner membrane protein of type IV secretion of T-DNA complex, VirB6 n=1 Tax=Caballeronia sordidicola TaxID=196367 RepID=A0A226X636_CABSO|nr:type IV secretion system protein [Caballeronia sordidicola]OXC78609.1 Inner membrane protein of type IV secretion of T-DNA complex, VirB6 [Caballeronia sordidicola]
MAVTVFTQLLNAFDNNVMNTINTGSQNVITLITPLMAACFGVYVSLVMMSYWRGGTDMPIQDFMMKMVAWVVILTLGMNITYYTQYVVPFLNGLGDDLATALTGNVSTGAALDTITNAYVTAMTTLYNHTSGIASTVNTVCFIGITLLFAMPFIAIAAAYIILAKFALGLLLALGPMFISLALFPATRKFFEAWIAQCLNYAFLVALFAAAGAIEINFASSMIPDTVTVSDLTGLVMMGIGFIFVSVNLPSLASQLAGGVGISGMVGTLSGAMGIGKALKGLVKGKDGSSSGSAKPEGGEINKK